MVNILHAERNDVQNKAEICERDLMILCKDLCRQQAAFGRLILQFTNLQARILEEHPGFPFIRVRHHGPN